MLRHPCIGDVKSHWPRQGHQLTMFGWFQWDHSTAETFCCWCFRIEMMSPIRDVMYSTVSTRPTDPTPTDVCCMRWLLTLRFGVTCLFSQYLISVFMACVNQWYSDMFLPCELSLMNQNEYSTYLWGLFVFYDFIVETFDHSLIISTFLRRLLLRLSGSIELHV